MKHFEKKLSGFSVVYLHNPNKCKKCLSQKSEAAAKRSVKKFLPQNKTVFRTYPFDYLNSLGFSLKAHKMPEDLDYLYSMPIMLPPLKTVKKVIKKKKIFNNDYPESSKSALMYPKKKDVQVKSSSKLLKKKIPVERSSKFGSVKKKTFISDKKDNGNKVPGKGTLKRKRWFMEKLNQHNDNYEDDLFEHQKFGHFQNLLEDESDNSETYEGRKTPVFPFSLSPRATTPTPSYKDCYSPQQLSISRKGAEEYQYRRMKRKKKDLPEREETPPREVPKPKTEDFFHKLEEVAHILNIHNKQREKTSDNEDDAYFSDTNNSSCQFA